MVKTILRNLIGNAIKYTNTGGEITISATERKQFVEIAVKDKVLEFHLRPKENSLKLMRFIQQQVPIMKKVPG